MTVRIFETCNCFVRLHFTSVPDVHITFIKIWTCLEDMQHLKTRAIKLLKNKFEKNDTRKMWLQKFAFVGPANFSCGTFSLKGLIC